MLSFFAMPLLSQVERNYLKRLYYDPQGPASFASASKVYRFVKKQRRHNISKAEIENWLQGQETYTVNKSVIRNFQRGRVLVTGIDDQWEVDLANVESFQEENDGFEYILCVIDVFSRFAWVRPLQTSQADDVCDRFEEILEQGRKPKRIRTDRGPEFTSHTFAELMVQEKINHFTTYNEKQANYVERFIQTIKKKLLRFVVARNNLRYIDHLQDFIDSYNSTFHSGIQCEPVNVTQANQTKLWWQMYWPRKDEALRRQGKKVPTFKDVKFKFNINDQVRITHQRQKLAREYDTRWTAEIFKIRERFIRQRKPVYKIKDWAGDNIDGTYYEPELQKTTAPPIWKIDEVTKIRGRGRNAQGLVSWKGWPKKFNSWEPLNQIQYI